MPNDYSGFKALGELVTGGLGTPGVYEDTLKKAYSTEEQLQQARRARSLAMIDAGRLDSRQGVTPELLQAALGGDIGAQAELGASVLGGNQTMNLGQLGDFQRPHYGQNINAAQEALGSGDIGGYNKFNAAAEGKSYQPVRELGGAYVNDGADLGTLGAIPTAEVASCIGENNAQGTAALIRANRPPNAKPSKIAERAATMEEDLPIIEREIGRPLTPAERATYLQGGAIKIDPATVKPLGEIGGEVMRGPDFGSVAGAVDTMPVPSASAIAYLKAHPEFAAAFESKYGIPAARYVSP